MQQRDFGRRFEHATPGGDWRGADKFELRRFQTNAVVKEEADALLDPDAACANPAIAKDLDDATIRALVFFPRANVSAELDQFTRAFFFELRAHPREFASLWNDQRKHAFASAPAHACEIEHA